METLKAQIEAGLKDLESLPTMPAIVNRLLSLTNDPDVDVKALADEIGKDVAITANIIKMSNSAYFKPSRQIRSVQEAIVHLGLDAVKDIVIIQASRGILTAPMDAYKMDEKALWEHCFLVGELCSRIATRQKTKTPPHVAFTGGLLHDIGKVVLIKHFAKVYRQLMMEMEKDPTLKFSVLEKKYMGYTHNEIGGLLLNIWKFPAELVEATMLVNYPERSKINPELCSLIHIANVLALSTGVGIDIGGMNESLSKFAIETLNLSEEDLQELYHEVPEYWEHLREIPLD